MGLDQSFYKDKKCEQEVLYFRKFSGLQAKIGEILDEIMINGKTYRLETEDLIKIRDYIALDGLELYWFFNPYEDELPESFNKAMGVLSRFIVLDEPLFYNGDW